MKVLSRRLPHTACDLVPLVFFVVVVVIFHAWESSGKNPNFGLKQESSESGDAQKASCNARFNRKPELLHQVISSWICWFTLGPLWDQPLPVQVTTWCIAAFASHNRPDQRSIRMAASPAENCTTARWSMLPTWRWRWFKIFTADQLKFHTLEDVPPTERGEIQKLRQTLSTRITFQLANRWTNFPRARDSLCGFNSGSESFIRQQGAPQQLHNEQRRSPVGNVEVPCVVVSHILNYIRTRFSQLCQCAVVSSWFGSYFTRDSKLSLSDFWSDPRLEDSSSNIFTFAATLQISQMGQ